MRRVIQDWLEDNRSRASWIVGPSAAFKYDPSLRNHGSGNWITHAAGSKRVRTRFPWLETRISDGSKVESRAFLPEEPLGFDWQDVFEGTNINTLGLREGVRQGLELITLHNVYLYFDRRGFCLFDKEGVSPVSPSLPLFDVSSVDADVTIRHGFLSGDIFTADNICHFTLDHLGRALLYARHGGEAGLPVGYMSRLDYVNFARAQCLEDRNYASLTPKKIYAFDRLDMFSDSYRTVMQPARFCDKRILDPMSKSLTAALPEVSTPKKIYVSRADAPGRRILNEDAFLPDLEKRGFTSVTMAGRPAEEQLAMFHNAECIVSAHGAGLTSMIACRPGTRVVEVFTPAYGTATYTALAAGMDLDYTPIFGDPVGKRDDCELQRDVLLGTLEAT